MHISELARITGVSLRSIRYYNEEIKYECLQSGIAKGKVKLNEIRREIEHLQAEEAQLTNFVEDLQVMLAKGDKENE